MSYKEWIANAEQNPEQESIIISAINMTDYSQPPKNVQHFSLIIENDKSAWLVKDGIMDQLENIFSIIDQARISTKPLLVHCMAGQSRSATILTAYLMRSCHQECESVLSFLKRKRFGVSLSSNLKEILQQDFQNKLNMVE